jgi:hypothetical protein
MSNVEDIIKRMKLDKKNFSNHVVEFTGIQFRRSSGVPRIEFTEKTPIGDEKRAFLLSPDAYAGICCYANQNLGATLVSEIPDDSVAELLMDSFLGDSEGQIQIITGTDKESKEPVITSLISPDIAVLPDLDIYDACVGLSEVTGTRLDSLIEVSNGHVMRFVTDREEDVRPGVGDTIQSGFEVFNSPKGHGPCSVSSYIKRLVCLNGMTRTESKVTARMMTKDKDTILQNIRDGILVAVGRFEEDLAGIINLVGQEVTAPEDMIRSIGQNFGIPKRDVDGAIGMLNEEPDIANTMWGVLNSMTRWANNSALPWDSRYKLQRTAFNIVDRGVEMCESCGSLHVGETHEH